MTAAAPVHARAHPPYPEGWPEAEYKGKVIGRAHMATRPLDSEGHVVPVLCVEVELGDARMHNTMVVEQAFPVGHFAQCEAAARRLKKGMYVKVQAPLVGLRLVARNTTHIHVIDQPEEQPA